MSTRNTKLLAAGVSLAVLGGAWFMLQPSAPPPRQVATPTEPADDPPAAAPEVAPNPAPPSAPRAETVPPSAAEAPAPASSMFQNTPRKRPAEPMRLHFAHTPHAPTPGIGLSKAACDELRERQQHADALSDRERLHLKLDCRGR